MNHEWADWLAQRVYEMVHSGHMKVADAIESVCDDDRMWMVIMDKYMEIENA